MHFNWEISFTMKFDLTLFLYKLIFEAKKFFGSLSGNYFPRYRTFQTCNRYMILKVVHLAVICFLYQYYLSNKMFPAYINSKNWSLKHQNKSVALYRMLTPLYFYIMKSISQLRAKLLDHTGYNAFFSKNLTAFFNSLTLY